MANENFGKALKHARVHKGFDQHRLVSSSRIPQSTISRYESGISSPTRERARKLAAAMGLLLLEYDGSYYFGFPGSRELTREQMKIIGAEPADEIVCIERVTEPSKETEEIIEGERKEMETGVEMKENPTATTPTKAASAAKEKSASINDIALKQIAREINKYNTECSDSVDDADQILAVFHRIEGILALAESLQEVVEWS